MRCVVYTIDEYIFSMHICLILKNLVFIKLSVFDDIVSLLSQCDHGSDPPSFSVSSILQDENIEKNIVPRGGVSS